MEGEIFYFLFSFVNPNLFYPKRLGEGDGYLRKSNSADVHESIRETSTALHSTCGAAEGEI